jgi:hypothetical protein
LQNRTAPRRCPHDKEAAHEGGPCPDQCSSASMIVRTRTVFAVSSLRQPRRLAAQ